MTLDVNLENLFANNAWGLGQAVKELSLAGVMGMLRVLRLMRGNQCLSPRDLSASRKEQPWNRPGSSDRRSAQGIEEEGNSLARGTERDVLASGSEGSR